MPTNFPASIYTVLPSIIDAHLAMVTMLDKTIAYFYPLAIVAARSFSALL